MSSFGHALDERVICKEVSGLEMSVITDLASVAHEHDLPLVHVLVDRGGLEEADFLRRLAATLGLAFLEEAPAKIDDATRERMTASLATKYQVMPLAMEGQALQLVCSDPFNWHALDELEYLLELPFTRVLATRAVIAKMLKTHYGLGADSIERMAQGHKPESEIRINSGTTNLADEQAANEPTVVNFVNKVVAEAIQSAASDIHFEPYDTKYRVRYRIDGMLEEVPIPATVRRLKAALVSRIKIMAGMDITERRLPQDGRARVTLGAIDYDLRISILPGVFGEAINIRIQSRQVMSLELTGLGFQQREQDQIAKLLDRPHGLILVTGPTGSGKSTTLYTCLARVNTADTKIITIEDPVEYWMEDVVQMQVHEEIGFTFARALRSMLRHDPDMMLIGEIRDRETADITIRSALTGHLVFATLHTNDAASAITRLLDIGIEPFLVATSLVGIVAQRLVRKVCTACKEEIDVHNLAGVQRAWAGKGCRQCRYTGYRGRSVIAEVLAVSTSIRDMIQQRKSVDEITALARKEGMTTLYESAMQAVRDGRTTVAEALRITHEGDE